MKIGKNEILGQIDQEQTDQFFQNASGIDIVKLNESLNEDASIRYNETIDRLEGRIRGKWSPFVLHQDLNPCGTGTAASAFKGFTGTAVNQSEFVRILTFQHTTTAVPNQNPGWVTATSNVTRCRVRGDTINVNTNAAGHSTCGHGYPGATCEAPWATWGSVTIDTFPYLEDLGLDPQERRNFYVTPYMAMSSLDSTGGSAAWSMAAYQVQGASGYIEPLPAANRDRDDPDFGKFIIRHKIFNTTTQATWKIMLTYSRFDNFIPKCKPTEPQPPPPPLPNPIVIDIKQTRPSLNIRDYILLEYPQWDGTENVNVKVNVDKEVPQVGSPGQAGYVPAQPIYLYGDNAPSITTEFLPAGSRVDIVNRGTIIGQGGAGGNGQGYVAGIGGIELTSAADSNGQPGFPAIVATVPVRIWNKTGGKIIGGSGGGAGAPKRNVFTQGTDGSGEILAGAGGGGGHGGGAGGIGGSGCHESESAGILPIDDYDGQNGWAGSFINKGNQGTYRKYPWKLSDGDLQLDPNKWEEVSFAGTGGMNAAAGNNSYKNARKAQAALLFTGVGPADGSTVTIDEVEFTFKNCPTDVQTCWDGSVYNRQDTDKCDFPDCPATPELEIFNNQTDSTDHFGFEYNLASWESSIEKTGRVKLVYDPETNFPDNNGNQFIPVKLTLVGDDADKFEIFIGSDQWRQEHTMWVSPSVTTTLDNTFRIRPIALSQFGEDGTYYADIQIEAFGLKYQGKLDCEVLVKKPHTILNTSNTDTNFDYVTDCTESGQGTITLSGKYFDSDVTIGGSGLLEFNPLTDVWVSELVISPVEASVNPERPLPETVVRYRPKQNVPPGTSKTEGYKISYIDNGDGQLRERPKTTDIVKRLKPSVSITALNGDSLDDPAVMTDLDYIFKNDPDQVIALKVTGENLLLETDGSPGEIKVHTPNIDNIPAAPHAAAGKTTSEGIELSVDQQTWGKGPFTIKDTDNIVYARSRPGFDVGTYEDLIIGQCACASVADAAVVSIKHEVIGCDLVQDIHEFTGDFVYLKANDNFQTGAVDYTIIGGSGGSGANIAGKFNGGLGIEGNQATGTVNLNPGDVLKLQVGGGGEKGTRVTGSVSQGGWSGNASGGSGGPYVLELGVGDAENVQNGGGGAGGGASALWLNQYPNVEPLLWTARNASTWPPPPPHPIDIDDRFDGQWSDPQTNEAVDDGFRALGKDSFAKENEVTFGQDSNDLWYAIIRDVDSTGELDLEFVACQTKITVWKPSTTPFGSPPIAVEVEPDREVSAWLPADSDTFNSGNNTTERFTKKYTGLSNDQGNCIILRAESSGGTGYFGVGHAAGEDTSTVLHHAGGGGGGAGAVSKKTSWAWYGQGFPGHTRQRIVQMGDDDITTFEGDLIAVDTSYNSGPGGENAVMGEGGGGAGLHNGGPASRGGFTGHGGSYYHLDGRSETSVSPPSFTPMETDGPGGTITLEYNCCNSSGCLEPYTPE